MEDLQSIWLMGPTASGKTGLALELARRLPIELISVDSALVYRDMDIGTAKPDAATLCEFPHHLVNILDPAQAYSAARFRLDALAAMREIHARGKIPLLVGGTMLYYRALQDGLADLPVSSPEVREAIQAEAAVQGWAAMHAQLALVDPLIAARLHPNDPQRVGRALEVWRMTGVPMSVWQARGREQAAPDVGRVLKLALLPPRELLRERIAERFELMLRTGLLDEVQALRARGDLQADMPSMRAVGYRQVWEFLDGAHTYERMVELGVTATRGLAKRQMTWLRSERDICDVTACLDHADGVARLVTALEAWLTGMEFALC
ncbi:MAG: tRNA (adenosine(37)-N6)-dimethylallyltransferase MiaA [Gammaproteobacteria bacterium 28-57-27]|nr:MAG: tRNA (adenosine(37)-N6)-dimethylallyltransferase MiaA [Gammaproteobacteria bacterium 28-57-27]